MAWVGTTIDHRQTTPESKRVRSFREQKPRLPQLNQAFHSILSFVETREEKGSRNVVIEAYTHTRQDEKPPGSPLPQTRASLIFPFPSSKRIANEK
eukprot:scaffold6215_cov124-Pinguiococcus_pyrenoidosus.AAC.1